MLLVGGAAAYSFGAEPLGIFWLCCAANMAMDL